MQSVSKLNYLAAQEQDKVNRLSDMADMLSSNIQFAKSNEATNEDPNPYLSPVAATYLAAKTLWMPKLKKEDAKIATDEKIVNEYHEAAQQEQQEEENTSQDWSWALSALGLFLMILAL